MSALMRRREDGGRIDRARPLSFSFNGKPGLGFAGDTVASALLANGVNILGRGPRHSRPRGIVGGSMSDAGAFVSVVENGTERTVLATRLELYEGLEAKSVLPWPPPSLVERIRGDRGKTRIEDLVHAPARADFVSESSFAHCDILIIGSGPAGLNAALSAGKSGARVMVTDEAPVLGGSLRWCPATLNDGDGSTVSGNTWLDRTLHTLETMDDVRLLTRSTATGVDNQGKMIVFRLRPDQPGSDGEATGGRLQVWKVAARKIILATGAVERPLTFPGNGVPGVMLASGMLDYARDYAIAPASGPVVFATNNDRGLKLASDLFDEGVPLTTVVDFRRQISGERVGPLCDRGIDLIGGRTITAIKGDEQISGCEIAALSDGVITGKAQRLPCRALAVSGGWTPRLDVLHQSGGTVVYDETNTCLVPRRLGHITQVVGAATGNVSLKHAFYTGCRAGAVAAKDLGFPADPPPGTSAVTPDIADDVAALNIKPHWHTPHALSNKALQWVDLSRDLTADEVAADDKNGTAPVDGANTFVGPLEDAQLTGSRPSVSFDFVTMTVDKEFDLPKRLLPAHEWHVDHGAAFRLSQEWLRPGFFTINGPSPEEAVAAEMRAARKTVAVTDLSALGKLEIAGPDAAGFLDRLCCTAMISLPPQTARYTLFLDESGTIIDQGVVTRLGETRFLVTVSAGGAQALKEWMDSWLASDLSHLKTFITPVSPQWSVIGLIGPRARQVLLELDRDMDVSTDGLPFLAVRSGQICGVPAVIIRTSHVGEVTFEIYTPADYGAPLWAKIEAAGTRLGIRPLGDDGIRRLAAEKGYIDATALAPRALTPQDLDPDDRFTPRDGDFIGKNALLRPTAGIRERLQLVALRGADNAVVLPDNGTILRGDGGEGIRQGRMAASFYSDALGHPMALALVLEGHRRFGDTVQVTGEDGRTVPARIIKPVLFDPNGRRRYG